MKHITTAQRRARLGERHLLARPDKNATTADIANAVVALHATDPASVYLSLIARNPTIERSAIADALYVDRNVLRLLVMRRTMFVMADEVATVAHAACASVVAGKERKRLVGFLDGVVKGNRDRWLARVEAAVLDALEKAGALTAKQLAEQVPDLTTRVHLSPGKAYARSARITTQVLNEMSAHGSIVRGKPSGGMGSSLYAWSSTSRWLGRDAITTLDSAAARTQLVRLWLERFGPGTLRDIQWWTGLTKTQTRAALSGCDAREVSLDDDGRGYLLPNDPWLASRSEKTRSNQWVALLPSLDPTPMGWKERSFFLGNIEDQLFDRSGNICPTVWVNGSVVGGWAQRPDGRVVCELLSPVTTTQRKAIDKRLKKLETWLGDERVSPRFPSPLDKRLARG